MQTIVLRKNRKCKCGCGTLIKLNPARKAQYKFSGIPQYISGHNLFGGLNKRMDLTYSVLKNLYVDEKLSIVKIAKKVGASKNTVNKYLKQRNICRRTPGKCNLGYKHSQKTIQNMIKAALALKRLGPLSPSWKGGLSGERYGSGFTKVLKAQIRKRDKYTCQECGKTEKQFGYSLPVHHIDYDKNNHDPENLVSLCRVNHSKTNFNRGYWIKHFKRGTVEGGRNGIYR